jgi:hypothetical protein
MKNYYLKRIDELKTEIGSDRNPRPIASAIRALGTGGAIKLADKLSRSGPKKRKGKGDSEKPEDKKETMDPITSGFLTRENSSTTYIQIGYILAESMGLIK